MAVKMKKCTYTIDLKTKRCETKFVGDWSRGDIDRMHRNILKASKLHKHDQRKNLALAQKKKQKDLEAKAQANAIKIAKAKKEV